MSAMQLETSDRGGVTVLTMSGDLEVQEVDEFQPVMDEVLSKGPQPRAVLDISGLTSVTSYVVALLSFCNAQFQQAGGHLVVAGAAGAAKRVFERSGLDSVLETAGDVEDALRMLGA